MTDESNTDGTWLLWLVAIVIVGALMASIISSEYEAHTTQSCMDSVVTPDPQSKDYDNQALEFTSEIRKCLRG